MKSVILLFLFIGIIFMIIGYIKTNQKCPPPIIEYRYYPKTFNQEMKDETPVSMIFGKMFSDKTPWIRNS
tara:strand:- start:816 stop:1025 length:210 start_codon:yes stop_codon:yes gene_type:complete